jgi:hypothetical protein
MVMVMVMVMATLRRMVMARRRAVRRSRIMARRLEHGIVWERARWTTELELDRAQEELGELVLLAG